MKRKILGATTAIAMVVSPMHVSPAVSADREAVQPNAGALLLAQAEAEGSRKKKKSGDETAEQPKEERAGKKDRQKQAKEEAQSEPAAEQPPAESAAEAPETEEAPAQETQADQQVEQPETTQEPAESAAEAPEAEQAPAQDDAQAEQQAEQPENEQESTDSAESSEQPEAETAPSDQAETGESSEEQEPAQEQESAEQPAPTPSENAPKPKSVAEKDISKQVEKAKKVQTAVVPENASKADREKLQAAEQQRREEARERRQELIGAAAIGAVVGALVPALGGRIVEDQGDRFVVERDGRYFVRKDEGALFRGTDSTVRYERMQRGYSREIVERPNGVAIVTVRDEGGYIVRREKVLADGTRIILYDAFDIPPRRYRDYDRELPPLRISIPRDQYIVSGRAYDRRSLAEVFLAPPVVQLEDRYTLQEVRENQRLRDMVRRVDLDTITFETGSAYVSASQVPYLADIAGGMLDAIDNDPQALFLVEGHTDAVGSDISNLTLSDRRAETVARILVEAYGVPPENLIVQGYGEQFLKVQTDGPSAENRRVTVRNIAPLLVTAQQ